MKFSNIKEKVSKFWGRTQNPKFKFDHLFTENKKV